MRNADCGLRNWRDKEISVYVFCKYISVFIRVPIKAVKGEG